MSKARKTGGGTRSDAPRSRQNRPHKNRPHKNSPRGPGPVGRFVRGIFRLVWAFLWRILLVLGLLTAGATGYYYAMLPPSDALFDGRGSGSVILRDVNREIFAW